MSRQSDKDSQDIRFSTYREDRVVPTEAVELSTALASAFSWDRVDPLVNVADIDDRVVVLDIEGRPLTKGR